MISVVLRPIRSPQWPNMAAPIGRAAKPDELGRERLHAARVRVAGRGKNSVREDQRGSRVIEEEVVPLDGRADRARQRCTPAANPGQVPPCG